MRRKVLTSADRYGEVGANVDWKGVLDHYYWDRVEKAYDLALSLGASFGATVLGTYRMVEGEALTRRAGEIRQATEWLQVEGAGPDVDRLILDACDEVGDKLGWRHEEAAMVSVLVPEADAPWHGARFGYFTDKYPYDKICVPSVATEDPDRLREVVNHEYTHLVVLNKTQGKAPEWLQEGLAMLVEGEPLDALAHPFRVGRAMWLRPDELDRAFHSERRDPSSYGRVWYAYQQAGVLGHFLRTRQDWQGIQTFLDAFTNQSFWKELKMAVTNEPSAEEALREVYAFGIPQLFDAAEEWIRAG